MCETIADTEASACVCVRRKIWCRADDAEDQDDGDGDDDVLVCVTARKTKKRLRTGDWKGSVRWYMTTNPKHGSRTRQSGGGKKISPEEKSSYPSRNPFASDFGSGRGRGRWKGRVRCARRARDIRWLPPVVPSLSPLSNGGDVMQEARGGLGLRARHTLNPRGKPIHAGSWPGP